MNALRLASAVLGLAITASAADSPAILQPRGRIHIPIGVPNTLDTLKTFVEAEGNLSPGFGTCGVFFAVGDPASGKVISPTQDGVPCEHGLAPGGIPIPWSEWKAGDVTVRSEVCEVRVPSPAGEVFVTAARVRLTNSASESRKVDLIAQVQNLGAAGGPLLRAAGTADKAKDADRVVIGNGFDALVIGGRPVLIDEGEGGWAVEQAGEDAFWRSVEHIDLPAGGSVTHGFICPVLPGRRAVGHRWDGVSKWAQLDLADPISGEGGVLQPQPEPAFYGGLKVDDLFAQATREWSALVGKTAFDLPDQRWSEAFSAVTAHAMLAMNEGAPDVAAINYNVFSRDGVYVANILQKSGNFDLARTAIDYLLAHPFNGRVEPEADNPGQVLWILGEHWKFTRDRAWLQRVYPAVRKLAAMIEYYRTTPEPHWVNMDSLEFGEALPAEKRQKLRPGACDGFHPEYTEAFDVAGLRGAVALAQVMKDEPSRGRWSGLAERLFKAYDERFGADLRKQEYGNYCVLWPCRLYPLNAGRAWEQFKGIGEQKPASWRYFPLARSHQGLLTGNRASGYATIRTHLDHEQMRGWYAFDEGGPSGPGNWMKVRSNWKVFPLSEKNPTLAAMAMPHGWSNAEMHLLLRDALVFEDGDKLVLFAGVPPEWFRQRLRIKNVPTHFGKLTAEFEAGGGNIRLEVSGDAAPPGGIVLRMPQQDFLLAPGQKRLRLD